MKDETNTSEEVNRHIREILEEMENPQKADLKKTQADLLNEKKSFYIIE